MESTANTAPHDPEAGMSLVEIVMALLIVGVTMAALLAALTTAVFAANNHRDLTTSDTVLRAYAESTKHAVRDQCGGSSGGTYSVAFTPPSGYSVDGAGATCPVAGSPVALTLQTTGPGGTRSLEIAVRRP